MASLGWQRRQYIAAVSHRGRSEITEMSMGYQARQACYQYQPIAVMCGRKLVCRALLESARCRAGACDSCLCWGID